MSYPQWLTPRRRKVLFWAAGLVLFYTVFGFFILPLIVRAVAVKQLGKILDRQVSIQRVLINPYVLSGTIRGLEVRDPDGQRFVGLKEGYANFQLISFFQRAWTFKEIRAVDPYARVQVNQDSTLNFSDLLKKFGQASPAPKTPGKPLFLHIGQFQISGAELSYADLTTTTPFRRRIGPVQFTLTGLHTDPENKNPYSFTGTTDSGERFSWSGFFFLGPLRSHGEFAVENVRLPQYAPAYQDLVRFDIQDGTVDLRAAYDFAWTTNLAAASVTNASLRLQSFVAAEKTNHQPFVQLGLLEVKNVSADAIRRHARVGSVAIEGGVLAVRRDKNSAVNLVEMGTPATTNVGGSVLMILQAATNLFAQLISSTNAATGVLREITVTNCALAFEDLASPRPVNLSLSDVALVATNLSNLPGERMGATASLRWNTNGALAAQLTAALSPPQAEVALNLDQLDLQPLGPYLDPFVSLFIMGSKFTLDGRVRLEATNSAGPNATFSGNVRLDDFAGKDADTGEDILGWGRVAFSGIEANLNPPEIRVAELALNDVSARVIMETNQALNFIRVARLERGTNVAAPAAGETVSAPAGGKSVADSRKKFGTLARAFSSTNLAFLRTPVKAVLPSIVLSNANLQLEDNSITPPARLALRSVSGSVTGLSSDLDQEIKLHLLAKVDGTGPVEITGTLPPQAPGATNHIAVKVQRVNLAPASPYSGKYLGYGLQKGALSLDIDYQMTDRKINAQNVLKLDQLTLGRKVPSPDATKLPVKLAVALLKDRKGLIELDVPIEGSLDDPNFRIGKAVLHVLGNIITKLVTSPFAALGSLFGGKGEEVSYQPFAPGSAALDPARSGDLEALLKGLQERPELQLEIEGSFDESADPVALQRLKLENQFKTEKWANLRKSEKERTSPDQIPLTPEEFNTSLKRAWEKLMEQTAASNALAAAAAAPPTGGPTAPQATASAAGDKGALLLTGAPLEVKPAAPVSDMERAVLQTVSISQTDLRDLAQKRAEHVQQAILATKLIEPERVTLAAPDSLGSSNRACRVFFHLQ